MATNMEHNILYERILRDEDPRDTVPIATLTKRKAIDIYSHFRRAEEEVILLKQDTDQFRLSMDVRHAAIIQEIRKVRARSSQSRLARGCIVSLVSGLNSLEAMQQKLLHLHSLAAAGVELRNEDIDVDDTEDAENHPIDLEPTPEDIDAILSQIEDYEKDN